MPQDDATKAAAITAGANLAAQGINWAAQAKLNKKQRQYAEQQYARQRADALADWAMQNEYNSPVSQMARFRDAGLNPNLIYGQSNEGATVRSTDQQSWNPRAPQADLGQAAAGGIMAYYDTQLKEATIDNLKAQNTVIQQDAALKAAQTYATLYGGKKTEFDLGLATELRQNSLEVAAANLHKTQRETQVLLDRNEREKAANSSSLMEAASRILRMRSQNETDAKQRQLINAQIASLSKDVDLKKLDENLKRMGVQPGDNLFFRVLGQVVSRMFNGNDPIKAIDAME